LDKRKSIIWTLLIIASILLGIVFAVIATGAEPDFFTSKSGYKVLVVAHRGANRYAPANTIPATEKAIALNLDFVEIDVRTTKDGKLVLMHNSTVDDTTDGKGAVRELTLEEIKRLDAGIRFSPNFKGTRVPTIEEYYAAANGKIKTYLDWKDADPAALMAAIEKAGAIDSTVVFGSLALLMQLKQIDKRIRIMPEADHVEQLTAMKTMGLKFETIGSNMFVLTPEVAETAHSMGAKVFVDILGQAESCSGVKKAIKYGADAVQTDNPEMVMKCLKSLEAKQPDTQPAENK